MPGTCDSPDDVAPVLELLKVVWPSSIFLILVVRAAICASFRSVFGPSPLLHILLYFSLASEINVSFEMFEPTSQSSFFHWMKSVKTLFGPERRTLKR